MPRSRLASGLAHARASALAPVRLPVGAAALAALLLLPLASAPALASAPTVECGQLTAYTAPIPAGPTDGSVTLGTASTWVVLADATISPAAEANLPNDVNSGPTCLALGLDGNGKVTSIDFAAQGTIVGKVTFDSGNGFYVFAARLIVPTNVTDAYPPISALFKSSYEAGTSLSVTFMVDTTTGGFSGFDGHSAFCGAASLDSKGVGHVGKATLPAATLNKAAKAALKSADGAHACATVHSTGTIDPSNGNITTSANVVIAVTTAKITPPSTTTSGSEAAASSSPAFSELAWAVVLAIAAGLALLLGLPRHRVRR